MNRKTCLVTMLIAITSISCGCANKAQTGAGIGAMAGAGIGALTFKNKMSGAVIGAGIGGLLGYVVGNEMDKHDAAQVGNTLESGRSGQTHAWRNPDTGRAMTATPGPAYADSGRTWRDVTITARDEDGTPKQVKAKAWRDDAGQWRLAQ